MLQAALDLSTSTKPFDSVTAAHLLNLLLHQEALQQALLHCAYEKSVPLELPDFIQASAVSILEKNTLAGTVKFCMQCLLLILLFNFIYFHGICCNGKAEHLSNVI